jgi:hypothetical protein
MIWVRNDHLSKAIMLVGIAIAYFQTIPTSKAYWADGQELLKWCGGETTELYYIECIG